MKVIFNCSTYSFHKDYYVNIDRELRRRGHKTVFAETSDNYFNDADYTIIADESQASMGGKCVWIGHSFDAKGAMWNDEHCLKQLDKNADYIFVYSEFYKRWLERYVNKPIFISGMAKLDGRYGKHGKNILFAPTFDQELTAETVVGNTIKKLQKKGVPILERRHPVHYVNGRPAEEVFSLSNIVISGYSSMGMEAIVLDKPTILVNNPRRVEYKSFPPSSYICNQARKAAIEVNDGKELIQAIETYKENPNYLTKERRRYGALLCEYRGVSTERTVDLLEEIYASKQ